MFPLTCNSLVVHKSNHNIQAKENIAYGEISHRISKNESGDIGMKESAAYGQVPCMRNEAYGVFPMTGDHQDI